MKPTDIPGWMNPAELAWLAEQARRHQMILELGCWRGRTTRALAEATQGQVFVVDNWSVDINGQSAREAKLDFAVNLAPELLSGKVVLYDGLTADAMSYYLRREMFFDMVFIDADHSYAAVRDDIFRAQLLLEPHGLLCGHDFSNDYPGVKEAVRELVPGYQRVDGGDLWFKEI